MSTSIESLNQNSLLSRRYLLSGLAGLSEPPQAHKI